MLKYIQQVHVQCCTAGYVHWMIIGPFISLATARLADYGSVLSMSTVDLERATQLSASDISKLQHAVALAVPRLPMVTGINS